jgi:uncharacterized membrane protein YvbJ
MNANPQKEQKDISNKKTNNSSDKNKNHIKIKKEFLIALIILVITLLIYFLFFSKVGVFNTNAKNTGKEIAVIPYSGENSEGNLEEQTPNPNEVNAII